MIVEVPLAQIFVRGSPQMRCELDWPMIVEYRKAMQDGAIFPPIVLFQSGEAEYWLADGFHRVHAALRLKRQTIAAEVRQGDRRDAILYAVGANETHGIRRTNADKRKAVEMLLQDEEWQGKSDIWIAKQCAVSDRFVAKLRRKLTPNGSESIVPRQGMDGRIIDTSRIGQRSELAFAASAPKICFAADEWHQMSEAEQTELLAVKGASKFNVTNENVEWALWTWNPVTGCLHTCRYCYARDIANRFYTHLPAGKRFVPEFYPERLSAPENMPAPDVSQESDLICRMGLRNVFVCSMADLFGKWVPDAWIHAVLRQAWDNPQWNFLFLTKFPIRMADFDYPPNAWLGTTVDCQYAVERAEKAFTQVRANGYKGIAWLSCEPMMDRVTFTSLDMFDWVVMGGASKSTQTVAFEPPIEWTIHLYNQAKRYQLPVYMKTNLGIADGIRVREYPWQTDEAINHAPNGTATSVLVAPQ